MLSPREHPGLDLMEGGELEGEFQSAIGEFLNLLAGVPDAFADELAGEGVKLQANGVTAFGGEDPEAVLEVLFNGKTRGTLEGRSTDCRVFHPGEDERAEGFAFEAMADDIPLIQNTGEVVGLEGTLFVFGGVELPVVEGQFEACAHGFADRLEGCQIHRGKVEALEGDQRIEVAPRHGEPSTEVGGQFFQRAAQGSLKGSALVLRECFLADEDGDEFRLGELNHGKAGNGLGEAITATVLIVGNRQAQTLAHEIEVALDGLGRNLGVGSQPVPVGEFPRFDGMKYLLHPVQRGAGVELALRKNRAPGTEPETWHVPHL